MLQKWVESIGIFVVVGLLGWMALTLQTATIELAVISAKISKQGAIELQVQGHETRLQLLESNNKRRKL